MRAPSQLTKRQLSFAAQGRRSCAVRDPQLRASQVCPFLLPLTDTLSQTGCSARNSPEPISLAGLQHLRLGKRSDRQTWLHPSFSACSTPFRPLANGSAEFAIWDVRLGPPHPPQPETHCSSFRAIFLAAALRPAFPTEICAITRPSPRATAAPTAQICSDSIRRGGKVRERDGTEIAPAHFGLPQSESA